MRHRHRRGHGRFFWRVYLNGLLLLVLVATAVAVAGAAFGARSPAWRPEQVVEYAAAQAGEAYRDPDRLAHLLHRAHHVFGIEMAVYDGERLIASNVDPPPPPLPAGERARLSRDGAFHVPGREWAWAAPIRDAPGSYVVLGGGWRPFSFTRAGVVLGAVLLALAVGSVPLARAVTAPLERLTAAARRLGGGDLSARAGLTGRGEVAELGRAFDEMAARLERLVTTERELLANVSHELRTPLARIRVALELAAEGDQERAHRYLREIGTDLGELERMVADVLTATRLDRGAGELTLRRQAVDVAALLAEAASRFRELRPARVLQVAAGPAIGPIEADPALLRRALDNLLDNAAKYSGDASPVELSARALGAAVALEVRDHGIGIEGADLPRLFTPFFRTDRSRARGTGGVGLGLVLVKRIAEAHGGSVEVESRPDQGTTVRIRLPAGLDDRDPGAATGSG